MTITEALFLNIVVIIINTNIISSKIIFVSIVVIVIIT